MKCIGGPAHGKDFQHYYGTHTLVVPYWDEKINWKAVQDGEITPLQHKKATYELMNLLVQGERADYWVYQGG